MKSSTRGIAGFLRSNGTLQTELRMRRQHFFSAACRRRTEIHMLVPLRDAKRNAFVQLIFTETLGGSVHGANQFIVVAAFFVQQRGRVLGVETKSGFHRVSVVGEVIHLLRKFGME